MKKIVTSTPENSIHIKDLNHEGIICFKDKKKDLWILAKIVEFKSCAFVQITGGMKEPKYKTVSPDNSIKSAMKDDQEIFYFNNIGELSNHMKHF